MKLGWCKKHEMPPEKLAQKSLLTTCEWMPGMPVEIPFRDIELVYYITPDGKYDTGHREAWFRCPCGDKVEIIAVPELVQEAISARCRENIVKAYALEPQV